MKQTKRCEPCRATGLTHCSDPENCGGPWDKMYDVAPSSQHVNLPKLPLTDWQLAMLATRYEPEWISSQDGFSEDDMRNYALEAQQLVIEDSNRDNLVVALESLLEVHDEPCRFDHHGYCQAHYLDQGDQCRVKLAREVIEQERKR